MNTRLMLTAAVCACLLLGGCAAKNVAGNEGADSGESLRVAAAPQAPQGMRLGAPYLSALNEQCYELFSESGPAESAQAVCLREGAWERLSPIYMDLPGRRPVAITP